MFNIAVQRLQQTLAQHISHLEGALQRIFASFDSKALLLETLLSMAACQDSTQVQQGALARQLQALLDRKQRRMRQVELSLNLLTGTFEQAITQTVILLEDFLQPKVDLEDICLPLLRLEDPNPNFARLALNRLEIVPMPEVTAKVVQYPDLFNPQSPSLTSIFLTANKLCLGSWDGSVQVCDRAGSAKTIATLPLPIVKVQKQGSLLITLDIKSNLIVQTLAKQHLIDLQKVSDFCTTGEIWGGYFKLWVVIGGKISWWILGATAIKDSKITGVSRVIRGDKGLLVGFIDGSIGHFNNMTNKKKIFSCQVAELQSAAKQILCLSAEGDIALVDAVTLHPLAKICMTYVPRCGIIAAGQIAFATEGQVEVFELQSNQLVKKRTLRVEGVVKEIKGEWLVLESGSMQLARLVERKKYRPDLVVQQHFDCEMPEGLLPFNPLYLQ